MNLYDDMIKEIIEQLDQLASAESARLAEPSKAWRLPSSRANTIRA